MEPITLITVVTVPLAVAAAVAIIVRRKKDWDEDDVAELARARARQRIEERAFSDTIPEHDPYRSGIEFIKSTTVTDAFNSHGVPLSTEQMNTINSIFDGMYSPPEHRPVHLTGSNVTASAGVPVRETAFDEFNTVFGDDPGYLAPDYQWPERHIRE